MKRRIIYFLAILVCFIGVILSVQRKETYKVHPIVKQLLQYLEISECSIVKMPDYIKGSVVLEDCEISDSEIEACISDILNFYNQDTLTLEFVKEEYGIKTIDLFYEHMSKEAEKSKRYDKMTEMKKQLMADLIKKSDFVMNQEAVARYAMGSVYTYEEEARMKGVSLDKFINDDLNLSKEDFYEMCYEEGESLIKSYLVVGAIAENECLTVSDDEIEGFEEGEQTYSDEDKVYISYQLLENKVYQLFFKDRNIEIITR